tara:strand:- start:6624 stop:7277 length:654 start_codon:yes stop_codon:yes gene_type:complete
MIYNIYKPVDCTSFDVVKKIRSITKEKKVGHGGTLDPFAEGVLIIGTGKDTKSLTEISGTVKSYRAILKLGEKTETMDNEGPVIEKRTIPDLTTDFIHSVIKDFKGKYTHIPPMFSAKRIDGVRLYKLARQNKTVERKPVTVRIEQIDLNTFDGEYIDFSATCSKGTYIRVLGQDIAEKLGTIGHLVKLVRTRVGEHHIEESVPIKIFKTSWMSTAH